MKKKHIITVIIAAIVVIVLFIVFSNNTKEYEGYWCKYNETSTIVVLLKENHKDSDRTKIETKIETFENVTSIEYISKEDYAAELGEDPNKIEIYDTYRISLNTMDSIGTYIEELQKMSGVLKAEQNYAKSNLSLFNIKAWGKYTYTDSDEATTADLEYGKYKMKKGVLTFTPESEKGETKLLYTKDGYLCGDVACTQIYSRSNSTCSSTK